MKRVQLNGADIEYDVRGSGAPVVFIHGAILSDIDRAARDLPEVRSIRGAPVIFPELVR